MYTLFIFLFLGFGVTVEARALTRCTFQEQSLQNELVKDETDSLQLREGMHLMQGITATSATIAAMSRGSEVKSHQRRMAVKARWIHRRRLRHRRRPLLMQPGIRLVTVDGEDDSECGVEVSSLLQCRVDHVSIAFMRLVLAVKEGAEEILRPLVTHSRAGSRTNWSNVEVSPLRCNRDSIIVLLR